MTVEDLPISRAQVARLLAPKSIAVIGVSERAGSAGRNCIASLDSMGYRGDVHIVSRTLSELDGRKAMAGLGDLPDGIDLAVLTLPEAAIIETVETLAPKKLGGIMCFASGFAEMGRNGQAAQKRLSDIARRHDIAFAGPNCLGYTNLVDGLHVTFMAPRPAPPVATDLRIDILSQSGAMANVIRVTAAYEGLGIGYAITTGNEAVLGVEDYLPFAVENERSRVIVMLVETIRRPAEFLEHAAAARAKKKPIVLLHLGKSQGARDSARSHTGALAGDYAVMEAFVRSRDVVLVDTLDELFDVTTVLAHHPNPAKGGVAIMTSSGAFKGFAIDYCSEVGLPIAVLTKPTRQALREIIPDFAGVSNPVDLTAHAAFDKTMHQRACTVLMKDPNVGCVLASMIAGTPQMGVERAGELLAGKVDNGKPLLGAFMSGEQPIAPDLRAKLAQSGIPLFRSPERGLRALARVHAYGDSIRARPRKPSSIKVPAGRIAARGALTEVEGKAILRAAGIKVPNGALATSLAEARAVAARIKYPVVIKAQAAALTHKSDVGGVILGIATPRELASAWSRLHAAIKRVRPRLTLDGVLVERMGERGLEMVVGARRDPSWGPTLMVGLGGIFAEALEDVRFLPADAHPSAIAAEMRKLKGAKLLGSFRGAGPRDVAAAADAAARIGALMIATPEIEEIDINPLIVYADGQGVLAVDALIIA
jgi:acetate---CoA ligase (ADP-forming)